MRLRVLLLTLSFAVVAAAQDAVPAQNPGPQLTPRAESPVQDHTQPPPAADDKIVIPSGTTVPVKLMTAISTKSARSGDKVYAETIFPLVLNEHMLIPAGTYVQGVIANAKRAGARQGAR